MAYAMMGGLLVATVLTLFFLPALYAMWYRVPSSRFTLEDALVNAYTNARGKPCGPLNALQLARIHSGSQSRSTSFSRPLRSAWRVTSPCSRVAGCALRNEVYRTLYISGPRSSRSTLHGRGVRPRHGVRVWHELESLLDFAGGITGPLLAYEVLTAFFLEAGFLGVMLFG